MNEPRKLKRGLRDISPLFESQTSGKPLPVSIPERGIECFGIFSPDSAGDSLFLTTYLASRLAQPDHPCSIISLTSPHDRQARDPHSLLKIESFGAHLKRFSLSSEQFDEVCKRPVPPYSAAPSSPLLFLDFEYANVLYFEKAMPVIDKWIILIQPAFESLSEAYKMMKAAAALNNRLEYFLLYDGPASDSRGGLVFERFSEMVSRRLRINLGWLGSLHLPKGVESFSAELALDNLFLRPSEGSDSVEKRSLAALVRALPASGAGAAALQGG